MTRMVKRSARSRSPQFTLMAMIAAWLRVLISRYAIRMVVLVELE
jgi:hypothetical protein